MAFPGQVRIRKLEVGDVTAEDLTGVMLDHPTVKAIAEVFGADRRHRRLPVLRPLPHGHRLPGEDADVRAERLSTGGRGADVDGDIDAVRQPQSRRATRAEPGRSNGECGVEKADDDDEAGVTVAEVFTGGARPRRA